MTMGGHALVQHVRPLPLAPVRHGRRHLPDLRPRVDPGRAHVATDPSTPVRIRPAAGEEESPPIPWHLKALAAAVALYLGFRAWQGIEWLLHQLSG